MDSRHFDYAICGGALAGLAMARALSVSLPAPVPGRPPRIAVIDRRGIAPDDALADDPRAVAVSAASVNLLTAIGVWPAVAPIAGAMVEIDITDEYPGSPLRRVLLNYLNRTGDGAPASWIVPNRPLEKALRESVAADPDIAVLAPAEVAAFVADMGAARFTLQSNARDAAARGPAECTVTARLAISCEGRRSALREAAGIGTVGWDYGQTAVVTTVTFDQPHGGRGTQHFMPGGPVAVLPLPGAEASIVWSEARDEAERLLALDDAAFRAAFAERVGPGYGGVVAVGPRAAWPLGMHLARDMIGTRLALVGDVAHGVHPIAGQGLNLGLRDIAALADLAGDTARLGLDPGSTEMLGRYQTWRRFDNMASSSVFDLLNRLFSNDGMTARLVRDAGLRLVDRLPFLKERIVAEAAGVSGRPPRLLAGTVADGGDT